MVGEAGCVGEVGDVGSGWWEVEVSDVSWDGKGVLNLGLATSLYVPTALSRRDFGDCAAAGMSQALKAATCIDELPSSVGSSHTTTVLFSRYSAHFRRQRAANSSE